MTQPRVKRFVCIGCPMGCPLEVEHEELNVVQISGNECKRGKTYARQEFTDPRRALSTTVQIADALWSRLPVRTTHGVPKARVVEAAREIHGIHLSAPVRMGQVLLKDLLGEKGLDVIATRSMEPSARERS